MLNVTWKPTSMIIMVLSLMCQVHPTDPSWGHMASLSLPGCWWVTAVPSRVRTELVSRRPQELSFPQVWRCPLYESEWMSAIVSMSNSMPQRGWVSLFQQLKLSHSGWSNTMKETKMEGFVIYCWNWLGIISGVIHQNDWHILLALPPHPPIPFPSLWTPPPSLPILFLDAWLLALFFCPSSLSRALSVTIELKQFVGVLRVWGEWAQPEAVIAPSPDLISKKIIQRWRMEPLCPAYAHA